jgi:hypothetical protein
MTDITTPSAAVPQPSLPARLIGVIFSPKETFAAVAARPKWFGALAVALLVIGAAQFVLLSSDVGKDLALEQNVKFMEALGQTIGDEQYAAMERQMEYARYTGPLATLIFTPVIMLLTAGLMHVMFGLVGGGNGTFKHVYAISAHAAIISGLQVVFTTIVTLAAGRAAGANLAVFAPTLEDTTFAYKFLSYIDLFYVWSTFITAVGLGVLYKRRTAPIAMVLLGIYFVIAALIAFALSGS